jgi:hypothetical protein
MLPADRDTHGHSLHAYSHHRKADRAFVAPDFMLNFAAISMLEISLSQNCSNAISTTRRRPPMKPLPLFAAAIALSVTGTALAAPGKSGSAPGHNTPPGQDKRPVDPDRGDDNASPIAILKVSSHNNPSAYRSAIVPQPDSE